MDADTNDSVPGIHASELALNGVVKPDDLQTAIINKDVMLSGVASSQTSLTSSLAAVATTAASESRVAMPTVAGKLSSSLADNLFVGLQSLGTPSDVAAAARLADAAAATGVFSTILTNPTQSVPQLDGQTALPQIILAAGAQSSGSVPLQQLLIPVTAASSSAGGVTGSPSNIQQLISLPVPVGAAAGTTGVGGQMQLLATPGGQLINVSNPPHLNVSLPSAGSSVQPVLMVVPSVNPLGAVLVPPSAAAAAQNIALQQQQQQQQQLVQQQQIAAAASSASLALSQQITNAQGQVVAIGAAQQLLQQALLAASQAGNSNAKLLACLSQPNTTSSQQAAAAALISSINQAATAVSRQDCISATTEAAAASTKVLPLVPNSSGLPAALAAASSLSSNGTISSLTHITPNINQLLPNTISSSAHDGVIVDGVNLDEMREFAKQFKIRRLSLGLTQTQVGQALSVTEGPSYSQSAICRFEKLDITPKSAQKIKPVLERWMAMAEERYKNGAQNLCDFIGLVPSKKRKRRTSFTPQALEILNEYFERSTHPTGAEMTELADKLNFDREVIRVWFCNKRQTLKNSVKKLNISPPHSS